MSEPNPFHRVLLTLAVAAFVLAGCSNEDGASQKVNGSVHITAGAPSGPAETVNGNVAVADDAAVTSAHAVNGGIDLGDHATADALSTVNGSISLGAGAHVAQGAQSVNGGVTLREGAEVLGAVRNVNGKIQLTGAHVGGGIETVNGSITIVGASRVEGGILVKKSSGISIHFSNDVPRIVIGPGATVRGDLRFEREVKLYVSDRAAIGPVSGTTPISFTGDTPPAD
jgi:DUF4097 and DUF4098 domain-containing protein YvlB